MTRAGGRESDPVGDTLDATLEELLEPVAAATLAKSFYGLFRIPVRVFSEGGTALVRSGKEPPLHTAVAQSAQGAAQLGKLFALLKQIDLGPDGHCTHQAFSGVCYHVVAVGHGGRRIGRVVIGPYLAHDLSIERFRQALDEAMGASLGQEATASLANALPVVKRETVSSIGRHLIVVLGLLLHESHQALLSARMHLASMGETQRELQRVKQLGELALREQLEAVQERSGVLNAVGRELQERLRRVAFAADVSPKPDRSEAQLSPQLFSLCDGLMQLTALEAGRRTCHAQMCSAQQLCEAVEAESNRRNLKVEVQALGQIAPMSLDGQGLAEVVGYLLNRVARSGREHERIPVHLTAVEAESPSGGVGEMLFLQPQTAGGLRISVPFCFAEVEAPGELIEAFAPECLPSAQAREVGVSVARRLAELYGGLLTLDPISDDRAEFALVVHS